MSGGVERGQSEIGGGAGAQMDEDGMRSWNQIEREHRETKQDGQIDIFCHLLAKYSS
jgi:hypothetical protein